MRPIPLGELCKFYNGGTPSKTNPAYYSGTIPWITSADINEGTVQLGRTFITPLGIEESATRLVPRGTILFVSRTGVGKVALAPEDLCFSQDITGIVPDEKKIDTNYLVKILQSKISHFSHFKRGATIQGIPRDILSKLPIPLPPLAEQKRIAAILDKADEIRRKREKAIELTDSFLRSVFLEMFGDPVTNPKGWGVSRVDQNCSLVRGSSPRPKGDPRYYGGKVPRLMVEDLTRDGMSVTAKIDSLTEAGARKSRPVPAGTVVMVVSGNVGLPAIVTHAVCIHDGFVGFLRLADNILPEYLLFTLDALKYTHERRKAGAIWQNLTTSQIKEISLPIPPVHLQRRFAELVARFRESQLLWKQTLQTTTSLINSLQTTILTPSRMECERIVIEEEAHALQL